MLTENMKIKKIIKYYLLGESLREIELNRILDKIGNKKKLSERERNFLDLYQTTREDEMKDFMLLSKNTTYSKIKDLLDKGRSIICNLEDNNGRFGLLITSIKNDFNEDSCVISMRGGEKHTLEDRYLYNIIYNTKKDQYSLESQDEYFEKIEAGYDND
jgi:hypothetical protein